MKSQRKTLLTGLFVGLVTAIVVYQSGGHKLTESCRNYREQMRQLATNDSGFAGVLTVSESSMTHALAERYETLTGEQCAALLPQTGPDLEALEQTKWAPNMKQAGADVRTAMKECYDKRKSGEIKTHVESAQCSNPRITAALDKAGYPHKDLVAKFTDKRMALAGKIDQSTFDRPEDEMEFARLALEIAEQERARLGKH